MHWEASQAMQQPALQPAHLVHRDHEAAIPARDAAPGCVGQQQGIPAGAVGGGQQHRAGTGQVLLAQHEHLAEKQSQGYVLADHHRQGCQPGIDAIAQAPFPGRNHWARLHR